MFSSDCRSCYLRRDFLKTLYPTMAAIFLTLSPIFAAAGYLNQHRTLTLKSETIILQYIAKALFCYGIAGALLLSSIVWIIAWKRLKTE